ncbi:HAD family acid phosphatase [Streptomyces sp. NPDC006879]|uniref:HAD family acid phosphatase n=1 Tax=Streptomyces sp. NPDC006879 TaxID=3364767 RepID=UPI003696ED0B
MPRHKSAMRAALTAASTTILLAIGPTTASAVTPVLTPTKAQAAASTASFGGGIAQLRGVDYQAWKRDVAAVSEVARPYLKERIDQGNGRRLAVVLDIDNTSLETDFHFFLHYPTPAVDQVRELARYASSRGVAVFFVTARPGIIASLTEHNLKAVGYPVSGLYVRDLPDLFDEVSTYKTAKRAHIESRGYTIIANIGNSPTDMVGGHAERTFKLPDYGGKLS